VIRHVTGDPPGQAQRATAALARAEQLLVTDVVFAECVYVLESFYGAARAEVATALRALLAVPSISAIDPAGLRRALTVYERRRLDFTEAHLVAQAEASGVGAVLSFDRALRGAGTIEWVEPQPGRLTAPPAAPRARRPWPAR
jgi:predicted nucleic acid-binding protein